ncbi:hypothetical protein [Methanobrevibacter sp. DSM 116169]|uniref:hypothetical protein n=1 Tax=Methanobrevibacter sp. DSM 116169 TaxID=3242727 RepID=UPI0038FC9D0A
MSVRDLLSDEFIGNVSTIVKFVAVIGGFGGAGFVLTGDSLVGFLFALAGVVEAVVDARYGNTFIEKNDVDDKSNNDVDISALDDVVVVDDGLDGA